MTTAQPHPHPTILTVNASPVKEFFIDVLTRDIELRAAILDLIDNSVDSAHVLKADKDFRDLRIDIVANRDKFEISDNCAGITIKAATEYVFRLGRPDEAPKSDTSIGQFGVGMKRALFKMGDMIFVDSATEDSHFIVDLDVEVWKDKKDDWDIQLQTFEHPDGQQPPRGTRATVTELHPHVAVALQEQAVDSSILHTEIASVHRMAIERGLTITVNGTELAAQTSNLAYNQEEAKRLLPLIERFTLEDDDGMSVDVEIYAGLYTSVTTEEDAEPEDSEAIEEDAGWYVFANDRLLIAADRSALTGWTGGRENLPAFHNQYARFRGYIFLTAEDAAALPWNTTKTGVEVTHPMWTSVREQMIEAGRPIIRTLNQLKHERSALKKGHPRGPGLPLTQALDNARLVTVASLTGQADRDFATVAPNRDIAHREPAGKRIAYTVPKAEFDAISEAMSETEPRLIGLETFRYYFKREVD